MGIRSILRQLKWPYWLFFAERDRKDYGAQAASWAMAALLGPRSVVRTTRPGALSLTSARDIAVLVTYDPKGRVHDFLLQHMDALAKAGRAVILVSNSPKFPEAEQEKAAARCALVAWRRNRGYDFGAWRDGLMLAPDYDALDSVIFVNDSVYGPFQPLGPILKRMDAGKADIWGLTDNWDTRWHLQSYFTLYRRAALQHPDVRRMWREWKHVDSKSWVIRNREIGMAALLQRAGLRCAALWPYRDLVKAFTREMSDGAFLANEALTQGERRLLALMMDLVNGGAPMNPTHFFWDALILDGFPYLKREVLTVNPIGMPHLYDWERVIHAVSRYDTSMIERHLRAILKHRVV
ncbi:MAG: hypothetical protein KIS81_07050 [Maricaulaceae bacterium]|nr:hypothetical protein [Maricaulaceae bacterium]